MWMLEYQRVRRVSVDSASFKKLVHGKNFRMKVNRLCKNTLVGPNLPDQLTNMN